MLRKLVRKLIFKHKQNKVCRLNDWNCPECIYHNWQLDGSAFRGNLCMFHKEWYRE